MSTIREKQIASLSRMLNFNSDAETAFQDSWKVLIYDTFCRDIIAPLMNIGELRKRGVTLHLLLESERQPIPDVPAVYFCRPTEENVKRIANDCSRQLYSTYHINFSSAASRPLLEQLAAALLDTDTISYITKIYDQYLSFISLGSKVFSLSQKDSYLALNDPKLKDADIEKNIDVIVQSLFSVFVTLGTVPIIRCPRNGAAEMVAMKLDGMLRSHLLGNQNMFSDQAGNFQRPLLVLADRNFDLPTMIHHTWTYEALLHDIFDMKLNRVTIELPTDNPQKPVESKSFDLDPSDEFWVQNAPKPFDEAATNLDNETNAYKAKVEEINQKTDAIGGVDASEMAGNTASLVSAVSSLPELTEKKKAIDQHASIGTALLRKIQENELDSYFAIEESIVAQTTLDKETFAGLMADKTRGTAEDKMRLFLIYYLCTQNVPDLDQYTTQLQEAGCDMRGLEYAKKVKAFTMATSMHKVTQPGAQTADGGAKSKFMAFADQMYGQGKSLLDKGIKNLIYNKTQFPITRVVDSLMELKSSTETDNYLYLDPKLLTMQGDAPRKQTPFKDAVVFMIGGGNYPEFQNLQEYAEGPNKAASKQILYGATELCNGREFLAQLQTLGGSE
eukprot:GFYU01006245.1.p1 GENE.GFYU01006245.1~~GFYU01006245.1.p1  ORF type:complete len:617 (-),score=171.70 GFYU01006245.1:90-1940(-)